MFLFIFFGLTTSIIMSEEKYELLFKWAIQNVKKTTSSELTKHATLIAISVDLEYVSKDEKEAFHKVYNRYKKIVTEEAQKKMWFEAYREVLEKYNSAKSISIPPEQIRRQQEAIEQMQQKQEFMEHYRDIYEQLR